MTVTSTSVNDDGSLLCRMSTGEAFSAYDDGRWFTTLGCEVIARVLELDRALEGYEGE